MTTHVKLERLDEFALLTLDRADALNALSFDILGQIGEAIDEAASLSDIRALLLTGAGDRAFCAGADIKELRNRSLAEQLRGSELGQSIFSKLDRFPVPSVALVEGYAFGGGMEFALAATFRLCSPNAVFGLPEVKLGLIPGYGGTQRLPRLIGEGRALEMILTGRSVKAEEAAQIGLVHQVVEGNLMDAGLAFARRFSGFSLPALNFARRAIQRAGDLTLHEGLQVEAELSTMAYRTADAEEGMAAFEEKRKPEFKDA
ncbi:enoyl-CoA hydratase/isomerase family protein [Ochrobactrum quorumnocens]|uniref:Enoyl-CoA hydratase/isomerase family protein n=1 Tax=Ochrobactrum quorumnocens TaxID=271865 RepID=A0A248UDW8_9HYPH|nr:enoyl-CoA hydratase-related protein [[Ochrobactrum] quorumnocens]ASV84856.1 enoyl-CoA hydratase/isomerase family protein [[Ochrobactrum] quorumnocens]